MHVRASVRLGSRSYERSDSYRASRARRSIRCAIGCEQVRRSLGSRGPAGSSPLAPRLDPLDAKPIASSIGLGIELVQEGTRGLCLKNKHWPRLCTHYSHGHRKRGAYRARCKRRDGSGRQTSRGGRLLGRTWSIIAQSHRLGACLLLLEAAGFSLALVVGPRTCRVHRTGETASKQQAIVTVFEQRWLFGQTYPTP